MFAQLRTSWGRSGQRAFTQNAFILNQIDNCALFCMKREGFLVLDLYANGCNTASQYCSVKIPGDDHNYITILLQQYA